MTANYWHLSNYHQTPSERSDWWQCLLRWIDAKNETFWDQSHLVWRFTMTSMISEGKFHRSFVHEWPPCPVLRRLALAQFIVTHFLNPIDFSNLRPPFRWLVDFVEFDVVDQSNLELRLGRQTNSIHLPGIVLAHTMTYTGQMSKRSFSVMETPRHIPSP